MIDNRGSAVAIVMMILGVVSLIGVALLTQSNLDVQFTSSLKSYDRMFGLADGASAIAYQDLRTFNREGATQYSGQEMTKIVPAADGTPLENYKVYPSAVSSEELTAKVVLSGFSTDARDSAGYQAGPEGYGAKYWRGEGFGKRTGTFGGVTSKVHTAVRKITSNQ